MNRVPQVRWKILLSPGTTKDPADQTNLANLVNPGILKNLVNPGTLKNRVNPENSKSPEIQAIMRNLVNQVIAPYPKGARYQQKHKKVFNIFYLVGCSLALFFALRRSRVIRDILYGNESVV